MNVSVRRRLDPAQSLPGASVAPLAAAFAPLTLRRPRVQVCEHAVDLGWLPKLAAAHAPRDARQAFRQARAQLKRTTAGDYCPSATLHDL